MRFLVDAQLPPALARWLVAKSFDAEHVGDCGLATASDAEIWDYALRSGSIILTKDDDLDQAAQYSDARSSYMVRERSTRRPRRACAWGDSR
jgi:predicted nuclease of predicted toxin-antitoxin system